ncbi:MAG TPA: OmpA family protein [Steroidobacteraceae bacterium]|nr:OmpA family protein [Steroidobacteraceae bacterium]
MTRHHRHLLPLLTGCLVAAYAGAAPVTTADLGEPVERQLSGDQAFKQWVQDPELLKVERGDRLEVQQVAGEELQTVKLRNLVPPIRFASGVAQIPRSYVDKLSEVLEGLRDRSNVRVHFVGHADSQRLSDNLARVFEDNAGLSRERAGEVAEHFKNALGLPPEAIAYEWAGDTRPIASNSTPEGRALNRRVEIEVWYDEPRSTVKEQEVLVAEEIKRVKVCRMETVCKLRYQDGHARRARVRNLVVPLRYEDDSAAVPADFTHQVGQAVENLRNKQNVVVRFIGHTDNVPLSGRNERIYGDHLALSKARARRVALEIQDALGLATAAVDSDGRGAAYPVASNETVQGRALNRRVEVEFWYDDPLQQLPDEPQICPGEGDPEMVTKVYDPPWGTLASLELQNGRPVVPPGYAAQLRRALDEVANRTNARLRFIGYTRNERLDRRTAAVYGDDVGLSAARAHRAMDTLRQDPALASAKAEHEGRGYVVSDDVVNQGFVQGEESFVRVQVVYDEPAPLDDLEGVDITRISRELTPKSPYELNLMRITVDGKPVDDPNRSSSDVQRCTDVALDDAKIQFRFDNLASRPRLGVAAHPTAVSLTDLGDGPVASSVRFRMYANYQSFIERAEIRVFGRDQSLRASPLAVVPVDAAGLAEWQPSAEQVADPSHELRFVLRAYDAAGNFDETQPQPLWINHEPADPSSAVVTSAPAAPVGGGDGLESDEPDVVEEAEAPASPPVERELLAAYGETALALHNIPLGSGTVKVQGSGVPANHSVWVAGREVPVDANGNFVAEEILPDGAHTVEVALLDDAGNGSLYLRDLEFKRNDWFYVGMADLTLAETRTTGPAEALQGADAPRDFDSPANGRLAFYLNGKFGEDWKLVASADTQEAPIEDLFSNFLDKSPDSLFRRIDPDNHYPTFGDDGVVEEMAPTLGKFYVKASKGQNYGLWGNFKVGYAGNELAQVDRGLYGANAHYAAEATTSFGERRLALDGFAAEPGTMPSYEEFRGTGGSLYYLRHQDLLGGSERVRIEVRDKASGIVTGVVNLRPGMDYDIDYLQGRLMLTEPLSSTASDNLLVRSSGVSGDEAYVVVRYEYTPGFDELDAVAVGGQGQYWFNDHVKLGLTASQNDEGDADSSLNAADLTLRMTSDTWFKVQAGQSEGLVSGALQSNDGGYEFYGDDTTSFVDADAGAYRADVNVGLGDFIKGRKERFSFYVQNLEAGYSAPGQSTLKDTDHFGGLVSLPLTERLLVSAKGDSLTQQRGVETTALELNVGYQLTNLWNVSSGVRNDLRKDRSPIVPLTQEEGERTDAVLQVTYDPSTTWRAYGFFQETLSATDDREDNGRVGAGGSYRITERFKVEAELSDGDLGPGARIGSNFLYSERTNLYLNYSLENERTDNGLQGRRGNLVSGVKSRLSDSASVYVEERYQDTESLTGLTHATGVNLAANERWTLGANADVGTLTDALTGAETDRKAGGLRVGYGFEKVQLSSAIEYRLDDIEQADTTTNERTTWLFRNTFKYQLTPDWRIVGKFNHSTSDSSEGNFYDGGFTEAVVGYAYRPIDNDRLNALAKYTYFYNVPTTDQVTQVDTAAEFIQKSHIAALDLTYELTPSWSIGGKLAYRLGQVSLDRENPEFFDNAAQLVVLRADWRFHADWEGVVEARLLELPDVDQRRSGALLGVYRSMGQNLKIGAGYNFTDFSDDLTDLSYDHQGAFVNVVGSL